MLWHAVAVRDGHETMQGHSFSLREVFKCAHLKFTVYGHKQANIHTHMCNAVPIVWCSLRLVPINYGNML